MQKIANIQALRGIAALCVVAYHLLPIEQKYGSGGTILPDFFKHGMFGVDLFFVISGFVMTSVTRGQFQSSTNSLQFIYHRASRIYPTYWFYTALVLVVFLLEPGWVNSAQGNQVNILSSFLLWPEHTLPLINVGWTLIHEMYFYLVFALLLAFVAERKLGLSLLIWAAIVVAVNLSVATNSALLKLLVHPLTLEFVLGCFLALLFRNDRGWVAVIVLAAVAVLALVVLGGGDGGAGDADLPEDWRRVAVYGVPAGALLYGLVVAEREGFVLSKYLVKLGDASYSIYLVHVLVLSAVGRALHSLAGTVVLSNAAMIIMLVLCVIVAGLLSYRIIERPLLRLTRKAFASA